VLVAGDAAGTLTEEGVKKLDKSGKLQAGVLVCPPEGDAGTGMVATNSVAIRTGNVSAGTSIFAMIVMEKALNKVHEEVDVVTTPVGDDVAMVHCNNCTSDINAWAKLFKEYSEAMGFEVDMDKLYTTMFSSAMKGAPDCGGLMGFNYFSGEPVTGFEEGRPVFIRKPDADFSFANFMRLHLFSAVSTLKYGLDILFREENVAVDKMYGHGGFFKTKDAGQRIMSAAIGEPVTVMATAGEGGAWGIALLALYAVRYDKDKTLADFLQNDIFGGEEGESVMADKAEIDGMNAFMDAFKKSMPVERAAVESF
jgi:sugar (pentulose or hexulose) kinase